MAVNPQVSNCYQNRIGWSIKKPLRFPMPKLWVERFSRVRFVPGNQCIQVAPQEVKPLFDPPPPTDRQRYAWVAMNARIFPVIEESEREA